MNYPSIKSTSYVVFRHVNIAIAWLKNNFRPMLHIVDSDQEYEDQEYEYQNFAISGNTATMQAAPSP